MKKKNRSMPPIALNLLAIWISIGALTHLNIANAAKSDQEKRIAQCPDGQYAGPGTGAKRFLQDPYVWFVSREFAKRFCVPEQLIDDSLKGALAVAVIIKPDDRTYCGLYAGRSDVCTNKPRLLLEIYVDIVVFAARAIVQIANRDFRGDLTAAAEYFTTTGHSQGGFEAELVAILFGVKGTSLDGMVKSMGSNQWGQTPLKL